MPGARYQALDRNRTSERLVGPIATPLALRDRGLEMVGVLALVNRKTVKTRCGHEQTRTDLAPLVETRAPSTPRRRRGPFALETELEILFGTIPQMHGTTCITAGDATAFDDSVGETEEE